MSSEALRAAFYAIGATLVAVGELDDGLVLAGLSPLGWIPAGVGKLLVVIGTGMVFYAKTPKALGDFSIKDVIGAQLKDAAAPKLEQK